uniref:NEDD8-activating enzyme E1 catalytic subunit n=1 Tax=Oryzias sinensis TaxID=183150 RepID=A0A8C8E4C5_9TELE
IMAVDGGHRISGCSWDGRWNHVRKFLERPGPFTHPDFEPSPESLQFLLETCKILVIGAGGLGCELLKNLALSGFRLIDVVDMDIIDVSNLNRQFLFRLVFTSILKFHIIVCGLDSIIARRWMNGMLISILSYDEGVLDPSSIIPLIDGGTEGFKGNARVILPGMTACIDCTLELYPPQINFPMCTIASMPRLPEHCIEYVRILQWPKETPFGDTSLDGDNPEHIQWVFERAQERAAEFSIPGVTYRLTQVMWLISLRLLFFTAACATEVFKIATSAYIPLNNYLVFNDVDGLYTHAFEAERKENCTACSQVPQDLQFPPSAKLQEILEYLTENSSLQMKSPAITTVLEGKNKTLYLQSVKSIEERTRPNLCKTLKELGLSDGQELAVADVTTPQTVLFKLNFTA